MIRRFLAERFSYCGWCDNDPAKRKIFDCVHPWENMSTREIIREVVRGWNPIVRGRYHHPSCDCRNCISYRASWLVRLGPVRFRVFSPKSQPTFSERNGHVKIHLKFKGWRITA